MPVFMSGLLEPADLVPSFRINTDGSYRGLRTKEYTFLKYGDGTLELYDLKADPYQLQNIAETAPPAVLEKLIAWLESLSQCAGASCRRIEEIPR
jgi:hypothetical protein